MNRESLLKSQKLLKEKNSRRKPRRGKLVGRPWGYIYEISNDVSGKVYIGQSVDVEKRLRFHFSSPNLDTPLYRDMSSLGTTYFSFKILDCAFDREELDNLEKYHIVNKRSIVPNGYNSKGGGQGGAHSDSTKLKMSRSSLGHKHTQATKDKMAAARLGKKHSKETRDKISRARQSQERDRLIQV